MMKRSLQIIRWVKMNRVGLVYSTMFKVVLFFVTTSFVFATISAEVQASGKFYFDTPPGLESRFDFWRKIYSEYNSDHAVIHDVNNLEVVYEVLYLGGQRVSDLEKENKLEKVKEKYRKILQSLARKKNKSYLTVEEKRVEGLVIKRFDLAAKNIRAQMGQKDLFEKGLVRSGRYIQEVKRILTTYGLPEELSILPQTGSFFNVDVVSSVDAVGIWQLSRKKGRQFMRVRDDIDERLDPILSTHAAAKILKENFQTFQAWGLAITAFLHGKGGMTRAKQAHGDNLVDIVKNYKSPTFGFDSKNFYAKFLAAYFVTNQQNKYFPNINNAQRLKQVSYRLDDYIHIRTIVNHFSMSTREIAQSNPALLQPVLMGKKRIPRGFVLRIPEERFNSRRSLYKEINDSEKFNQQIRQRWHIVQRGDTLFKLGKRYGISVQSLKYMNNIGRGNRIYQGRKIKLSHQNDSFNRGNSTISSTPSLWPVRGPITSEFGWRKSSFTGLKEKHKGSDIGASGGSPIRATADGVVVFAGKGTGYGNMIEVNHGNNIATRYAHNSRHLVKAGDIVRKGEVIARVGSTGRSTGPHLHYEVLVNRVPVDPEDYIPEYR